MILALQRSAGHISTSGWTTTASPEAQLTCEDDGKDEDEQKVLAGLAYFEPAAALFPATGSRRPPAADAREHRQREPTTANAA